MDRKEALKLLVERYDGWPPCSGTRATLAGVTFEFMKYSVDVITDTDLITIPRAEWNEARKQHTMGVEIKNGEPIPVSYSVNPCSKPLVDLTMDAPGYESLGQVLMQAYLQAAEGKGAERHADDKAFDDQPMQLIQQLVGHGFALGQAIKKCQESQRMGKDAAVRELLGAIVYIAGAIIHIQK